MLCVLGGFRSHGSSNLFSIGKYPFFIYEIEHKFFVLKKRKSLEKSRLFAAISFLSPFYGGEGETRTLAPGLIRPTPLAGAPRHQLEYFSIHQARDCRLQNSHMILYPIVPNLSRGFCKIDKIIAQTCKTLAVGGKICYNKGINL